MTSRGHMQPFRTVNLENDIRGYIHGRAQEFAEDANIWVMNHVSAEYEA